LSKDIWHRKAGIGNAAEKESYDCGCLFFILPVKKAILITIQTSLRKATPDLVCCTFRGSLAQVEQRHIFRFKYPLNRTQPLGLTCEC
jgi:hypothetical protein